MISPSHLKQGVKRDGKASKEGTVKNEAKGQAEDGAKGSGQAEERAEGSGQAKDQGKSCSKASVQGEERPQVDGQIESCGQASGQVKGCGEAGSKSKGLIQGRGQDEASAEACRQTESRDQAKGKAKGCTKGESEVGAKEEVVSDSLRVSGMPSVRPSSRRQVGSGFRLPSSFDLALNRIRYSAQGSQRLMAQNRHSVSECGTSAMGQMQTDRFGWKADFRYRKKRSTSLPSQCLAGGPFAVKFTGVASFDPGELGTTITKRPSRMATSAKSDLYCPK